MLPFRASKFAFVSLALGLSMTACGPTEGTDEQTPQSDVVESTRLPIVGGTETDARPEVGHLVTDHPGNTISHCTGTLISPGVVLTAAHCVDFKSYRKYDGNTDPVSFSVFSTSGAPLGEFAAASSYSFFPETTFDNISTDNLNDVAIVRLASKVPEASAVPAQISRQLPAFYDGSLTYIGFGCSTRPDRACSGVGTKRYRTVAEGTAPVGSGGDSGGPIFEGSLADNGPILEINSGTERDLLFGEWLEYPGWPILYYERILAFIRSDFNLPLGWESSTDRAGADFETTTQSDALACAVRCANNSSCKALSFVASTSKCWLKNAVRSPTRKKGVLTLVVGSRSTVEAGYKRNGSIYKSIIPTEGCPIACAKEGQCRAWNGRVGSDGNAYCDLIDTVGGGQTNTLAGWNFSALRGGMQYFKRLTSAATPWLKLFYGPNQAFGVPLPSIYSERDCQAVCAGDSSCRFWVYDWGNSRPSCSLYRADATGSSSGENVVSGRRAEVDLSNSP